MKAKKILKSWNNSHWEIFFLSFRAVGKVGEKSDLLSYHFIFPKSIDHKYFDGVKKIYVTRDSHY